MPAVAVDTVDRRDHGTRMAGLGLFGSRLDAFLVGTAPVILVHRLEAVKILPDDPRSSLDPLTYGTVTAAAVSLPELTHPDRSRVFCLPITTESDTAPGRPTLWSASLDALACGTPIGVDRTRGQLQLLGGPEPDHGRLFCVSVGNVRGLDHDPTVDYLDTCDTTGH